MKNILIIAKWEINRLVTRFGGRSGMVILAIVLLAVTVSFLVYHSGAITGKELYTAGVSANAPEIRDQRFTVLRTDPLQGQKLLEQREVDVYVDESNVYFRNDDRSRFVKDTLLQYLAEQDLLQAADTYGIDRTFPLRVEIVLLERQGGEAYTNENDGSVSTPPPEGEVSDSTEMISGDISGTTIPGSTDSDAEVERQLEAFEDNGFLKLKETMLTDRDVIIPSLTPPILPMAQVILVFAFVLPVLFVAVFFASSFAEERISRRLVVLLSTPVTPLQVILGKLLPYMVFAWGAIVILAFLAGADILVSLAIYTPVILFVFAAYMIVALMYRSFKDLTYFSVVVITAVMLYLVVPALLTGISSLSYISPLTLAVEMYRGEKIGIPQYFLATVPLYLIFLQTLFIGTRVFNEEYLMGYKSLPRKMFDAMKLAVSRSHLNLSAFLSSFFLIPIVFVVQLLVILMVQNVPAPASLWFLVILSATLEELAKSVVLYIVIKDGSIRSDRGVLGLAALSGIGFFIAEKLLLLLALSVLSESSFTAAVFSGGLWIFPLVLHVVSTGIVGILTKHLGERYYFIAVIAGTILHAAYNLFLTGVIG